MKTYKITIEVDYYNGSDSLEISEYEQGVIEEVVTEIVDYGDLKEQTDFIGRASMRSVKVERL
jgi:hypothetical protein